MNLSTVEDFIALKSMLLEGELHYDELLSENTRTFWNEMNTEVHRWVHDNAVALY